MTNYSIKVKKGEIEYSISSKDKFFVSEYIESFFGALKKTTVAFEYVSMPKLYAEKNVANSVLSQVSQKVEAETRKGSYVEKNQEKTIDEMVKSLFDKSAEDTIIQLETQNKQPKQPKEDLSSLTNLLAPKLAQDEAIAGGNLASDFDVILEDKISNPVYEEIQESKIFNYDELLKSKKPESPMEYLIITAYYMLENENIDAFQLKQLNAKLFNSMNMVVDRKTVQKAIEEGLVTVVSDGIQNDGVVEYALTHAGQEFYTNGLS